MSAPTKLRGGQNSEITRLKALWLTLSDDARSFWQELFVSPVTQAEIRKQLLAKLKINLRFDAQLNAFRDWELEQRARDLEAERQMEDERRILSEHPNWNLDQAREAVLTRSYERSISSGDFKLGLATVVQDLNVKRTDLESRRIVLLEKKAAAYDRAQVAMSEAKASKGGITKETLAKIESELKLL